MATTTTTTVLQYCPVCRSDVDQFGPGPSGRPDATCPRCYSLERHRFLALLLDGLAPWLSGAQLLVDIAPSRQITPQLRRLCPGGYVSLDFDPAADGRPVDLQASLTALPLPDDSVDLVVCYHVLEHVPDDRVAMAELARVLKPGGIALVQVPWKSGVDTDEDPSASPEERTRRFGQADHVRWYGRDFEERLRSSGLDVTRFTPPQVVGDDGVQLMRLAPGEAVWAVRAATGRNGRDVPSGALSKGALAGIMSQAVLQREQLQKLETVHDLERELTAAREESARWELNYRTLRDRAPVRVLAGVARVSRRLREARR